jgi:hypothetical protein
MRAKGLECDNFNCEIARAVRVRDVKGLALLPYTIWYRTQMPQIGYYLLKVEQPVAAKSRSEAEPEAARPVRLGCCARAETPK